MFDLLKRGRRAQMSFLAKILLIAILGVALILAILKIASKFRPN